MKKLHQLSKILKDSIIKFDNGTFYENMYESGDSLEIKFSELVSFYGDFDPDEYSEIFEIPMEKVWNLIEESWASEDISFSRYKHFWETEKIPLSHWADNFDRKNLNDFNESFSRKLKKDKLNENKLRLIIREEINNIVNESPRRTADRIRTFAVPILPIGKVNTGTGKSKYFNVFETWGDGSTYEVWNTSAGIRIVVTSGKKPLYDIGDIKHFEHDQSGKSLFQGSMVDFGVGIEGLKKIGNKYGKSIPAYVYK